MYSMEKWLLLSLIISFALFLISFFFKFEDLSVNSNEPFECGMESMANNRVPFFMQFYLIAILFLIFDIEFVVTLPMIVSMLNFKQWSLIMVIIFTILITGLLMEVFIGTLEWKE